VLATDIATPDSIVLSNVGRGLTEDGLLLSWDAPEGDGTCWTFELRTNFRYPDGSRVVPLDLVKQWTRRLEKGALSDAAWLLRAVGFEIAPSGTIEGVKLGRGGEEAVFEVCPDRAVADLRLRLGHPVLWLEPSPESGDGPGPYRVEPDGYLRPNPLYPGTGPYVDRVEWVRVERDPALPIQLGDTDAAIVFGDVAQVVADDPGAGQVDLRRLPEWDRTYFLWLDPDKRWFNDPEFRRWLAGADDRNKMLEYLFAGRGERAFSLSRGGAAAPRYELKPDRPLDAQSVPRLDLVCDAGDPLALTIASRLEAVLSTRGVELTVVPVDATELRRVVTNGDAGMALLAHHPTMSDPVLALLETVWWLGPAAQPERDELQEAGSEISPQRLEERRASAWKTEDALLENARVVPLVRLHAWLARDPRLAGVRSGGDGVIHFDEAWWIP
jgi:MarR-like DNA-binding transcriptional regulator SgrR of sgrS sRNA